MKILLSGPIETASLAPLIGDISGLPLGTAPTPVNVLASEYVRNGHDVCVVTLDPKISERVSVSAGNLQIIFLPRRPRARDIAFSLFEREIVALQHEYELVNPDIIHAHWTYEFAEAGIRTKMPTLVTSHDSAWEIAWIERDVYRIFRLLMALRTLPRIRNLSVVAPYLAKHMRCSGYFGQIDIVPNGLDLGEWPFRQKALPASGIVIAAIGNGYPRKNIKAAVAAHTLIRSQIRDAELHLFGHSLERYAGIDGIVVHGTVNNQALRQFHQGRTTILVHPSLQEVCPVSIIEARALGIPVVAGVHSGGVPYVMGDVDVGLVDIRKPKEIANAVLSIVSNPVTYRRLSEKGREDVLARFDIGAVAKRYLTLYRRITDAAA